MPEKKELHESLKTWRESVGASVPTKINPEYDQNAGLETRKKKTKGKK